MSVPARAIVELHADGYLADWEAEEHLRDSRPGDWSVWWAVGWFANREQRRRHK